MVCMCNIFIYMVKKNWAKMMSIHFMTQWKVYSELPDY